MKTVYDGSAIEKCYCEVPNMFPFKNGMSIRADRIPINYITDHTHQNMFNTFILIDQLWYNEVNCGKTIDHNKYNTRTPARPHTRTRVDGDSSPKATGRPRTVLQASQPPPYYPGDPGRREGRRRREEIVGRCQREDGLQPQS